MQRPDVNYIVQLNTAYSRLAEEEKITAAHLSLYWTLFQLWNMGKFLNPFSICRSETMKLARIGSKTTYYKTLKDLAKMGYIEYHASNNPMIGSQIKMIVFETSTPRVPHSGQHSNSPVKELSHNQDNSKDNLVPFSGQQVVPSINNRNSKPIKQQTKKTEKRNFSPPAIDEVKIFFLELKSNHDQAEQFYNHFESNGWLVGGKAKMKDWKAAARNWVKRSQNFSRPNNLNTPSQSNYNTPL
ncbi:MAG: transcriptional regulator [Fluviicola sp.]